MNLSTSERVIRSLAGEFMMVLSYFWLTDALQIIFYVIGALLLITGIVGYCSIYQLLKNNKNQKCFTHEGIATLIIVMMVFGFAASYLSIFFSDKMFLNDFKTVNNYYKKTLFNTAQDKRTDSITNYEQFMAHLGKFRSKYSHFRPFSIKDDKQFDHDIARIFEITSTTEEVYYGDLSKAHKNLETIRPIFAELLKRSHFSLYQESLNDLADQVDVMVEAAENKDKDMILKSYYAADEFLMQVESESQGKSTDVRTKIEELHYLAEKGSLDKLPEKGEELEQSFNLLLKNY